MTEEERKMLAFVTKMVEKMAIHSREIDVNEIQQLDNIASDLGYYELDDDEFRY